MEGEKTVEVPVVPQQETQHVIPTKTDTTDVRIDAIASDAGRTTGAKNSGNPAGNSSSFNS